MWLTEKSGWIIFALTVVGIVLGVWFKSRHGMVSELPTHLWSAVTPAEVFAMLATVAISYWVAVKAVARNRRGEPPFSLGIVDWLIRMFDVAPAVSAPFRSPAHAQFWVEWRRKGEVMPAIVVVCLVAWLVIWFFASRDAEDLVNGFLAGGGLLSAVGLACGLVHGNVGTNDSEFAIGHFMATRPITNADLARTILRAAAQSVLLAWAIWAAAFLFAFLMLMLFDAVPMVELPEGLGWWYFPATLAGLWTAVGCVTSIGLAGRAKLFTQLMCGLFAAFIGLTLFSKFALSNQAQWQFERAVVAIGATCVLGTAWMFLAARRRLLIQWPTVWARWAHGLSPRRSLCSNYRRPTWQTYRRTCWSPACWPWPSPRWPRRARADVESASVTRRWNFRRAKYPSPLLAWAVFGRHVAANSPKTCLLPRVF